MKMFQSNNDIEFNWHAPMNKLFGSLLKFIHFANKLFLISMEHSIEYLNSFDMH